MTQVRLIQGYDRPDVLRQTPGGSGRWGEVEFSREPLPEADYVLILNRAPETSVVRCPPDGVWAVLHEPPIPAWKRMHRGQRVFSRVYTPDETLHGDRYVHRQVALPWHVERTYDELVGCPLPEKPQALSWITSNKASLPGHRRRMRFLERLREAVDLDLFGRGFHFLEDKWDGLAPYRYALAVENFEGPHYWSEKLADCFLAWCMPIYHGCTNIESYFPPESMVRIDVRSPQAVEQVREAVAGDRWKRNRDAVAHARDLILNHYQVFPFVADAIRAHEAAVGASRPAPRPVRIKAHRSSLPVRLARRLGLTRLYRRLARALSKE